jgi:hypothetical protein
MSALVGCCLPACLIFAALDPSLQLPECVIDSGHSYAVFQSFLSGCRACNCHIGDSISPVLGPGPC